MYLLYFQVLLNVEKLIGKKKEHTSITQSKTLEFYVENPNREKLRSSMQVHYIIREITREEERTSQPLCIYNGIHTLNSNNCASPFIEKTRIISYEITKLP